MRQNWTGCYYTEMKKNKFEFIPEFKMSSLSPRHWIAWLGMVAIASIALTPASFRDPVLGKLGMLAGRLGKGARRRAQINLSLCFPERSETEREAIVDEMFATALQSIVMMAELAIRGPEKLLPRVFWKGREVIDKMSRNNEKVIFFRSAHTPD